MKVTHVEFDKPRKGFHLGLLGAIAVVLAGSTAGVSSYAAEATDKIEEIVVTAEKRPEDSQSVPVALTAISGSAVRELGLDELSDLNGRVPGLNFSPRDGMGVVTIRGIGLQTDNAGGDPAVAIYQDGIYSARPGAALANFYDVQRLEVARGPQGTLYGRNATGGAVNFISNLPTANTTGYVDASYGNYNSATITGALSGALGSDQLLGRIAFQHDSHDGYQHNVAGFEDLNSLGTNAVKGTLEFLASDTLKFFLRADYSKENDTNYTPILSTYVNCNLVPGVRTCGTAYGGIIGTPPETGANFPTLDARTFKGLSLEADWNIGFATFKSLTGLRNDRYFELLDIDGSSFPIGYAGRKENSTQYSQEFQLVGDVGNLAWVGGLYYFGERDDAFGIGRLNIPDDAPLVALGGLNILQFSHVVSDAYALFGQGTYKFTPDFSLTIGGRYSIEQKHDEGSYVQNFAPSVNTPAPDRERTYDSFTPKVAVEYTFAPQAMVYANVQKGFKSGGFVSGSPTNPPYEPETVWSYESGLKATWLEGRLRTNLTGFFYDYTNLQVSSLAPTGPIRTIVNNAAKARIKGVEFETIALPFHGFRLEGNLSLIDGRYNEYTGAQDAGHPELGFQDLSGNRMAQLPHLQYGVAAQYDWSALSGNMSLRGEFNYSSAVFFSAFDDPVNGWKAYRLGNAYLSYKPDQAHWKTSAYVRNLSNEVYATSSSTSAGIDGAPILMNIGAPRTYGLKVSFDF